MKKAIRDMTVADRVLLVLLLSVSLTGIFIVREAVPLTAEVIVEMDGRTVFTAPLDADKNILLDSVHGKIGIEIKDHRVRINEAHCPNRLCMKEGWVSQGVIVCLPSKVVVFVGGRGNRLNKELDAVTG
ncbi:MAG: NusG domain II-containing protein [Thermodesulfovibrionales bacterium]